ncbi:energy-coupling factor ABC transporter ATP-binding protein [Tessaracoccus antarcticus]|uniref:ABC transporter ATP-binding protein n=1 Tax=Tessaracoccus antarcticus TaxID=2479848 RepID=A0A3M0GJ38_9ACTN|nr:ATP-binding cassette domain-containing protein [Tessaracoccus antarcticus]RMB61633.1 ATP-binding cassette domain-containing protein [Tessaracoccus antarcticus]
MKSAPPLLAAHRLVARFPGGDAVLRQANFTVTRGRRVALLGANGSGKTTLLRCLSGALKPAEGEIAFDGQPLRHDRVSLRGHRARVQLVLQNPDEQLFSADVRQDVSFGPLNLGLDPAAASSRVEESLDLLGITHLAERPVHQLSYGERKRVTIAGAVAMRPQVLLLDEPTAGLDPAGVAELMQTLDKLSSTVVLATHDVDLALMWADELAIVTGHLVRQGGPDMLADASLLEAARLRRPWQLDLLAHLGHDMEMLRGDHVPRTVADVAAVISRSASGAPTR